MAAITVGQAIVEVLKAEGSKFVFGIPGGHTLPFYDALYHTPEIRHILVRHEQAAPSMAAAYANLTGEPGICSATAGPGATNIVSGIAEAFVGALPVIAIIGRGSARFAHRGMAQEVPQDRILAPISKWVARVENPEMIVEIMRQAFTISRTGKPGPVVIDIPVDVMGQTLNFTEYVPVGKPVPPAGNPELLRAAVGEMVRASRPIVVAGGGTVASGAFSELRDLVETLGIPVLTTLSGRGSFPDDHPLAGGGLGVHRTDVSRKLLGEADFVLGLGCRFEQMETNWRPGYVPAPDACYVQIDVDPTEIGRSVIPRIGIVSDVKLALGEMIRVVRETGGQDHRATFRRLPRVKELLEHKEKVEADAERAAASNETPISPLRAIMEIREAFPRETTVAIDIGQHAQHIGGAFPYFKMYEPRSCIPCTSFYAMGYASLGLPVAKLVYPERPAVGICGDGSFQMIMNILPVAAQHRLPVTWCILDDGALGSIQEIQEQSYGGRVFATSFDVRPDFAKIAEACKCYGEKVEDPRQIRHALGRAIEANNRGVPAVLDFIVKRKPLQATYDYSAAPKAP